jgi:probable F420-dependent oxidoreductase
MHFGLAFVNAGPFADPGLAIATARAAEAAGIESLWTVEHVLVPAGYQSTYPYDKSGKMPGGESFDICDPLIWMAYVAAATERIKLATGILIAPQRNPPILAKEVATLDFLSGGRTILGVGAGWLEEEFDALGVPFADRGKRLDSTIAAMRALWAEDKASYSDEFVSFTDCISLPKPPRGAVPIHIGGHSDVAARRAGRLGDGFFPGKGSHEELARLVGVMRDAAEEAGRDAAAIEVTVSGAGLFGGDPAGELDALREIGVHRVMIAPLAFDAAGAESAYADFAENVMAKDRTG